MLSLYEITASYRAVLERIDDAEGVLDEQLEADLDAVAGTHADKVDACVAFARALDAEAEAIKAEEQRLAARRKAREARADRLRAYVLASMKATNTPKLSSARFTVSIAKNPPALKLLVAETEIPETFVREVTRREVDKGAIRLVLESAHAAAAKLQGEAARRALADIATRFPFAELTRGERLSIR